MTFIPGVTLDKVWPNLPHDQKEFISSQLNTWLLKLRAMKVPDDILLGGVGGEGCKDTRRQTRICQQPIRTNAEFEDFKFSNPHFGGSVYIKSLRSLEPSDAAKVVFSHGDFRPENILVDSDQRGLFTVSGIIDWERCGFYPDYFECAKATSNMSTMEEDDWYLYLPPCASPTQYPVRWLLDRLWDCHVV